MMEALTLRELQETDMIKPEDGKSAIGALGDGEKTFFGGRKHLNPGWIRGSRGGSRGVPVLKKIFPYDLGRF